MRRLRMAVVSATVLIIAGTPAAQAVVGGAPRRPHAPALGFMQAVTHPGDNGGWILDNTGQPFTFRGINVQGNLNAPAYMWGGNLSPESPMYANLTSVVGAQEVDSFRQTMYQRWITEADMAHIAALGFNSVRVPIEAQDLDHYAGAWEELDRIVAWGDKYHLYILPSPTELPTCVPDVFPFSDYSPGRPLLWDPHCDLSGAIRFWKELAARYKDDHWIGGYDIANEPDAEGANRDAIPAVLKTIIDAVRTVDANHMVIAEGDWFATDFGPFAYGTVGQGLTYAGQTTVLPPIASNMAYMFHSYNLSGNDVNAQSNIDGFNKIAVQQGVPFFNGEFGANTNEWVKGTRAVLEDPNNKVHGWMFWTWKDVYAGGSTHYVEEITASDTWKKVITWAGGQHELGIADPTQAPTPDEVRQGMAEFLNSMLLASTGENAELLSDLGITSGGGGGTNPPPPVTAKNCNAGPGQSCQFVPDGFAVQGYIAATSPGTTITVVDNTDPTQPPFSGSDPGVVLLPYI